MSAKLKNSQACIAKPSSRRAPGCQQASAAGTRANVRVVVRVRPLNKRDQADNCRNVICVVSDSMLVFDPAEESKPFFFRGVQLRHRDILKKANKNLKFEFDAVFGADSTNEDLFAGSTRALVASLMEGLNCSVFAYGATGAGKTYTMIGSSERPGIIYLTVKELFERIEALRGERSFDLAIAYLEVYNENVHDLLKPGKPLPLREDGKYGTVVSGCEVKRIQNAADLFDLLEHGNRNRTQHPTDANAESSRSHAIFQVFIEMTNRSTAECRTAKLCMIDLAGSERGAATGFTGMRFTEGANINKSLLALGNCINSLAEGHRHVPYRDSKLTRLLKDSLGGNCQTVMVANVSPSSLNYEDTYNTLKYATRAKKIKSQVSRNIVRGEKGVAYYARVLEEQKKELEALRAQLAAKPAGQALHQVTAEVADTLHRLYVQKTDAEKALHQLRSQQQLGELRRKHAASGERRFEQIMCHGGAAGDKANTWQPEELPQPDVAQVEAATRRVQAAEKAIAEFLVQTAGSGDHDAVARLVEAEDLKCEALRANLESSHLRQLCDLQTAEVECLNAVFIQMGSELKNYFAMLHGNQKPSKELIEEFMSLARLTRDKGSRQAFIDGVEVRTTRNPTPLKMVGKNCNLNRTFVQSKAPFNGPMVTAHPADGDVRVNVNVFRKIGKENRMNNKNVLPPMEMMRAYKEKNNKVPAVKRIKLNKPKAANKKFQ